MADETSLRFIEIEHEIWRQLAVLLDQGRWSTTREFLVMTIDSARKGGDTVRYWVAHLALGIVLQKWGVLNDSLRELRLCQNSPIRVCRFSSFYHIAKVFAQQGNFRGAQQVIQHLESELSKQGWDDFKDYISYSALWRLSLSYIGTSEPRSSKRLLSLHEERASDIPSQMANNIVVQTLLDFSNENRRPDLDKVREASELYLRSGSDTNIRLVLTDKSLLVSLLLEGAIQFLYRNKFQAYSIAFIITLLQREWHLQQNFELMGEALAIVRNNPYLLNYILFVEVLLSSTGPLEYTFVRHPDKDLLNECLGVAISEVTVYLSSKDRASLLRTVFPLNAPYIGRLAFPHISLSKLSPDQLNMSELENKTSRLQTQKRKFDSHQRITKSSIMQRVVVISAISFSILLLLASIVLFVSGFSQLAAIIFGVFITLTAIISWVTDIKDWIEWVFRRK